MIGTVDVVLTDGTILEDQEVHWYQCKDIGKIKFKVKKPEGKNG